VADSVKWYFSTLKNLAPYKPDRFLKPVGLPINTITPPENECPSPDGRENPFAFFFKKLKIWKDSGMKLLIIYVELL